MYNLFLKYIFGCLNLFIGNIDLRNSEFFFRT